MKVKHSRMTFTRKWIITRGVVVSALLVLVLLLVLSSPQSPILQQAEVPQTHSWISPGVYAFYSGSSTLPDKTPYNMTFLWKVLAANGSEAQVLTEMNLTARSGQPTVDRHVDWISIEKPGMLSIFALTDNAALASYGTTVTIAGKTVPVMAYVYDQTASSGTKVAVFINEDIGIPVQITFSSDGLNPITDSLVRTNIPDLLP